MQITVFGAAGRTGQLVVSLLLAGGHQVVAFVHHSNPYGDTAGVTVVKGSIEDSPMVERAVAGSQAVISALGSWHTKDKNIVSRGTEQIIAAMAAADISRLITLTGSAALRPGEKVRFIDKASHALLRVTAPKILVDGEAHLRYLEASQLDWTTIRSPAMVGRGSARYTLTSGIAGVFRTIPRAAVAQAMVDQVADRRYYRQAPTIQK